MKKICVRAPQWVGDAVVSTIFISALKEKFPEAEITVLCKPYLQDIYLKHPAVTAALALTYNKGDSVFEVGRALQKNQFDAIYILPHSARTLIEAVAARVPEKIGFSGFLRTPFLTHATAYSRRIQYPDRYLSLLGLPPGSHKKYKTFFPSQKPNENLMQDLLGCSYAEIEKPILGISPKSVAPSRTWPAERFAAVANAFQAQKGGTVFLFGIESERPVTARVKALIQGRVIDFTNKLPMPQLTSEFGWLMQECDYFLVNDSGLMHIAGAFDVPTVTVFGASDPEFAVPSQGRFKVLQHTEISCVPCVRNHCVRFGDDRNACLNAVDVNEVVAALLSDWSR